MNENTITILVVGAIAVASMALIPSKADTIALASISGLVGFLAKAAMTAMDNASASTVRVDGDGAKVEEKPGEKA